MDSYFGDLSLVRMLFQRSLAAVYLLAFVAAYNQCPALLGEKGLLPITDFVRAVPFRRAPSLFYFFYSDKFFLFVTLAGILLSAGAFFGLSEKGTWGMSTAWWLALWVLYLSIVNVGQTFYAFGWESMLLEAGFFAAFLGPSQASPSLIPVLALRWMFFRLILGAGLIKLRNDPCWRDLTCLFYHYETQPIPNPLSWYFHHLPKASLMAGVFFNHVVEVVVPFGLLGPQGVAAAAALIIIAHQIVLILGGNYLWLNLLTIVLGLAAFSDKTLQWVLPWTPPAAGARPPVFDAALWLLAGAVLVLSVQPVLNLFSRNQRMNYSYNPIHLVNDYGVFGSITQERYEIVIEGTSARTVTPQTEWKEYEFKGKPGDVRRMPPQIAPYHLRLDWVMWFLPFSVRVTDHGIRMYGHEAWFLRLVKKLLEGDRRTGRLLGKVPFPDRPPHFIRARYYLYRYTDRQEKKETGAWWKRTLIDEYLPPVTAADLKGV